jgi:hypothetical protein
MKDTPRKPSDTPPGPPRGRDEDEKPAPKEWREPGGDVKEPPPPGIAGTEERFPREGEI